MVMQVNTETPEVKIDPEDSDFDFDIHSAVRSNKFKSMDYDYGFRAGARWAAAYWRRRCELRCG